MKPFVILERGGNRVGIIGIVTEEAPVATHPRNLMGLSPSQRTESPLRVGYSSRSFYGTNRNQVPLRHPEIGNHFIFPPKNR